MTPKFVYAIWATEGPIGGCFGSQTQVAKDSLSTITGGATDGFIGG